MPNNSPEMSNKENWRAISNLSKKERRSCSTKSPFSVGNSPRLSKKMKVVKEMNSDEEVALTVKARPYRVELDGSELDGKLPFEWIKCKPGTLRLYKRKDKSTSRLVLRHPITGVVKLNLAIRGNVFDLEEEVKTVKKRGRKPKKWPSFDSMQKRVKKQDWSASCSK